jgi:uncharacterized protein YbbC (DUF1343 family)
MRLRQRLHRPRAKKMDKRALLKGLGATASLSLLAACGNATPRKALPDPKGAIATPRVSLGIDELAKSGFASLKGKRVGFISNQTSTAASGTLSRQLLQQGLGGDLKALFGPEHGLDTRARAGDHVANSVDPVTGLRVFSLYGPTRKPSRDMLADLDVLVFEIQDIGVRSYTYISTMALAMEACGEAGKDFVVLDRPNPLGGDLVQGPPMEEAYRSFVGQVPVPYRHGLTIGELAKMIVAKGWIKANPRLTVVPMQGWARTMSWADAGLNWIPTSPNIPNPVSPHYCATTGILGELRGVDIGIGTAKPFQYAAAPGIDADQLARDFTAMGFEGVRFLPYRSTIKPGFNGMELMIDPTAKTDLMALGIALICEIAARTNGEVLRTSPSGALDLFTKVYGSQALGIALERKTPWRELVANWQPSLDAFRTQRAPYLLYR